MAITPLPLQWLTKQGSWTDTSEQEVMASGSDIHRSTIGFDPIISKQTLRWVAPPEYVAWLRNLIVVQDQLVGIYSIDDDVLGTVHVQPDGPFTWKSDGMSRWEVLLPVRVV